MKVFHCDHCGHLVFFENTECVACGHRLAYLPDLGVVGSLEDAGDDTWRSPLPRSGGRIYRLCRNYSQEQVCNWTLPADDPNPLCLSCRLTRVIPDLTMAEHRLAWYRLEVAKRRLVFTLLELHLPILSREEDARRGLTFEFMADPAGELGPVFLTGHADGVITINIAEADDAERERRRTSVHEPYRTLLGHMRHESGHYYWDRIVRGGPEMARFSALFGDPDRDYGEALRTHYERGAPVDWQTQFVSAYASSHAWEDWAETWAHYLHIIDTLETAAACGLSLQPGRRDEPALKGIPGSVTSPDAPFDRLIETWLPITYALNNLNRGLGLSDAYPFVLSPPAIEKLRFVHDVIGRPETWPDAGRADAMTSDSAPGTSEQTISS